VKTMVPELNKYKYKLDDQTLKHDNCDIFIKHKELDEEFKNYSSVRR